MKRLTLSKLRKSPKWENKDLEIVQRIKRPKTGVIGKDLQTSLLLLVNRIKETVETPKQMEFANIRYFRCKYSYKYFHFTVQ